MSVSDWTCRIGIDGPDKDAEISGFYFLEAETDFKPQQELVDFLKAGEAPIYIG